MRGRQSLSSKTIKPKTTRTSSLYSLRATCFKREKLKRGGPQLCWGSPSLQKGMAGEAVALRAESELALGRRVDAVQTAINEAETKEDEVVRANGNEAEAAMAEAISLLNHFPATTRETLMKMALGAGSCKLSTMKPKKKILSKKKKKLFETKQSTLGGEKTDNAGQNLQISEIEKKKLKYLLRFGMMYQSLTT